MNTHLNASRFRAFLSTSPLMAAAVLALGMTSSPQARADAKVYQQTLRSTVWVVRQGASGSGVLVDAPKRLVITNEHVVGDALSVTVFFPEFENGNHVARPEHYAKNREKLGITGLVLAVDAKRDLAILQLSRLPQGTPAVPLAARSASVGETVHAIGNPGASQALWIYTTGNVRANYHKRFQTSKLRDMRVLETDLSFNYGDSGGPIVNGQGELVAVMQSFDTNARLLSNSVDVSEIKGFLAEDHPGPPVEVTALLDKAGLNVVRQTPTAIGVRPAGGQGPAVFIGKQPERYGKAHFRRVFALAQTSSSPLKPETALKLLEQNSRTKIGGWVLERDAKGQHLVIYVARINAGASAENLAAAVEYVSRVVEEMKPKLNPKPKS